MSKTNRDEFADTTKREIAKRAGYKCSYPGCPVYTVGPTTDGTRSMDIGTAAHIVAAAPGGPRPDPTMSRDERRSASNGIWMCRNHGTAIDAPDATYTTDLLHEWKRQAYEGARRRMLNGQTSPWSGGGNPSTNFVALRDAARTDLAVFRRTAGWPSAVIDVTVRLDDMTAPSPSTVLARALMSLGNLILVAPPGTGKTTTLLRTAERLVEEGGAPLVVSLADWAVDSRPLLSSILDRPAFRAFSEDLFRSAATRPGVILLLDGWNELDLPSRNRVRVEVDRLRAELPELGLMVATRRQATDVSFIGTLVELLPLDDSQQMALAEAMRGDAGRALLDHAWRTPGLRALTAIPLYLSALLSMPGGSDLPATREEALRLFVDHHEKDPSRDKHLRCALQGFQGAYLEALAASMTDAATTAAGDADARRAVSVASAALMEDGQIAARPQPNDALDALVGHHILVRASGATGGISFQHQQFQEWYASHEVERRILAAASDPDARKALMAAILDRPAWEEAILFAVERLSRRDAAACSACADAVLAAFEVDPMLAAEMIARATEPVWARVASEIDDRVRRWHEPGEVDRAVRFMLTTGRPEFLDAVWPLITHKDEQVSLHALRSCARFRPTVLGVEPTARIAALPAGVRATLLCEIAENSGIDGLDLARDVAARDPDPGVRADVARMLVYRRADRHVAAVLEGAADEVFDRLHHDDLEDEIADEAVRHRLAEARRRWAAREGLSPARLRTLVPSSDSSDHGPLVGEILDGLDADAPRERIDYRLLGEAYERYPAVTVASILRRLREDRPLLHGSGDVLVRANIVLEDDDLARIACDAGGRFDQAAIAAAGVLGPVATGQLLEAYLEMERRREALEHHDAAVSDRCHALLDCLRVVPGGSLVAAATARGRDGDIQDLARLANLIGSHARDRQEATPSFDADAACRIQDLVRDWGERMLAAEDAERKHKASLAYMACRVPAVTLLPIFRRLLDDNLERFRAFREEAQAAGWRSGKADQEARIPMMESYRAAFSAIVSPETAALMRTHLADEHFGACAGQVLAAH